MLDAFFFYVFALLILGGGILTITLRSAVHCAISLIVSLLGVGGLYLLQKAEFLFATQIVVYIGGIMVLFLFVIMLVNLDEAVRQHQFNRQWWVALIAVIGVFAQITYFVFRGSAAFPWNQPQAGPAPETPAVGNTEQIADILFGQYLLPFELASVLLLIAVVGSVFLARRERG